MGPLNTDLPYKLNMPPLTKDQRVWICVEYARVNNAEEVRRRWLGHWPNDRVPTTATIKRTFDRRHMPQP